MINKVINKVNSEFYNQKIYSLLEEIKEVFQADEVYILQFDDFSVTCLIHLGSDTNCVNYHKYVSDSIERVAFEENIPIVIWDSTKDPRVFSTPFSIEYYTLLAMPISFKNTTFGTITIKRKKEITNADINLLNRYIEKLVLLISDFESGILTKNINNIISQFFLNFRDYSNYHLNDFIELVKDSFNRNGYNLDDLAVFLDSNKFYGNLPCYIDSWANLSKVCPAFFKDSPYSSNLCKHSKIRNYYCRLIKNKTGNILFSFLDSSDNFNNTSLLLERIIEFYALYKKQSSFIIYYKFFEIVSNLLDKDYISLDNVFNNFSNLFFDLFSSCAVIIKIIDSKEIISEHCIINPNFSVYSSLIYNFQSISKDYFHSGFNDSIKMDKNLISSFNGTFSIKFKYKGLSYLFDIIFINKSPKVLSEEIFNIKNILFIIVAIVEYINSIYSEINQLKLEVKNFYLSKKKLEDNLKNYENKILDLEHKIYYHQFTEKILKDIDECSNYSELEQKLNKIFEELDNITDFKINSVLVIIWNKVLQRMDRLIAYNISENVRNQIIEIIDSISESDQFLTYFNLFSEFKLIKFPSEEFSFIQNFIKGKINSIINIPILYNNEILGTILMNSISKIDELNSNEINILKTLSNEIAKFIKTLTNDKTLVKFRNIQALVIELFNYMSKFERKLNIFEDVYSFFDMIFKNVGFKNTFIYYSHKRDNNNIHFKLNQDFLEKNLSTTDIKMPDDIMLSLKDIEKLSYRSIKRKDITKLSDDSLSLFIKKIFYDNHEIKNLLILPIGSYELFTSNYEYKYVFMVSLSKDITILDTGILHFVYRIPSILYNNAFLRYINIRDKEILQEMFEIMKEGIIAFDLERNVILINKSAVEILGINAYDYSQINYKYKIDDLILDRSSNLYSDLNQLDKILSSYINSGYSDPVIHKETTYEISQDLKYIDYFISYITLENSDVIGYLLVIRNITDKKIIEKEKDDFIASISHDIKTPLTTMKGYITALLRYSDKITEEQRDSYLRVINSEMDRLNRMLNNLMDLRRLEGNVLKVNLSKFDLIKIIKKVVNIFELSYVRYEFELISKEESVIVNADKDKIEQVLHNLLSNAVKYSPTGGKITITVKKTKKEVIVGISDQGMGIPPEDIDKIFEKYYRTSEATKHKKISGKGLGLYITKKLIELHNGRIWVESKVNEGSTFYFSLNL